VVCEICGRPATVHVTTIANGRREDHYLCESCARERGDLNLFGDAQQMLENWIQGITGLAAGAMPTAPPVSAPDPTCHTCGLSFSEFARTGLLGCPDCYAAFRDLLAPVIRRAQGQGTHTGKVPRRAGRGLRREADLRRLREELQRAIQREAYEEAARLRDEIRRLEQEGASPAAGEGTGGGIGRGPRPTPE
jgi:protein arginine kinase activator